MSPPRKATKTMGSSTGLDDLNSNDVLMNDPEDNGDETNSLRISENVIAAVVRKYTLEIEGVVRFASSSLVGGIAEMIGRKSHESSIVVDIDNDSVNISVTLVLQFGVRIPDVAAVVQEVLRLRVEEITGKRVGKVDVLIQDLDEASPDKEQA